MRASYNWLRELSHVDASPEEVAERLTSAGLEVESVEACGKDLAEVVVAEVLARSAHPDRDRLTVVRVQDGTGEIEVVCGADNVPDPGGRVLFARVGAKLPGGFEIGERKLGGVLSRGMICSEEELGIGSASEGIFVLEAESSARPGAAIVEALGLLDSVYEIGLTPNRPDGLGHVGLARELAVLCGQSFSLPEPIPPKRIGDFEVGVPVEIADPDRCPRYGAGLVRGATAAPSPFWLRYRLHCLGLRPIHNLVDATNMAMLEWGHPTHAFDLSGVRGGRIVVRVARDGEKMITLDGVEHTFTSDDLLICDGEGPVAVAGVMGGENSEIAESTRDVLIECAYFDARSVRRTGRRLALHTDASHRFERGVDPRAVPRVLARTTQLIADLSGGEVARNFVDVYPRPIEPKRLRFDVGRAGRLLGFTVEKTEARALLEGIGCTLLDAGGALFDVTVPTWRPDIGREVDLDEEVARLSGYDRIPTDVPPVRPSAQGSHPMVRFVRDLRVSAAAAGLTETIGYAFVAPHELEAARVPVDAVALQNPLSEERAVMRTSLLPSLAAAARRSQRHQVGRVQIFELGRTYHPTPADDPLPREERMLGVLLLGNREAWIGEGEAYDFYDVKGVVEAIVRPVLGASGVTQSDDTLDEIAPWLHPRRRASVFVSGLRVGSMGELHPEVAESLDLEGRAIYGELSVTALLGVADRIGVPQARPLPRYPSVTRDMAMVVDEGHTATAIADHLKAAADGLAEAVHIFDLYRGEQIPVGKKSMAFRIVYRDPEATLTDKRVDKVHAKAAKAAEEHFGASLR